MIKYAFYFLTASSLFAQGFGATSFYDLPWMAGNSNYVITPVVPFSPTNLSGLVLWTDSFTAVTNNAGTLAAHGDTVKYWGDLSGNGYHLMKLASAQQPYYAGVTGTNKFPCIVFTNYIVGMNLTNACGGTSHEQTNTYFFVIADPLDLPQAFGESNYQVPSCYFNPMNNNAYGELNCVHNSGLISNHAYAGVDQAIFSGTLLNGASDFGWPIHFNWGIVTMQFSGTNSFVRVNGVTRSTLSNGPYYNLGTNGMSGFTFGSYYNGTGSISIWIASILWYSNVNMPTNNCLAVEEYLGNRFSITVP